MLIIDFLHIQPKRFFDILVELLMSLRGIISVAKISVVTWYCHYKYVLIIFMISFNLSNTVNKTVSIENKRIGT